MNRSVLWSRVGVSAAVAVVMAAGSGLAAAQEDDGLALKMAEASQPGRVFGRAGLIYVKVKTKSGDTYDVTGPVVSKSDLINLFNTPQLREVIDLPTNIVFPNPTTTRSGVATRIKDASTGTGLLVTGLTNAGLDGLGTPAGIKGVAAKEMGTAGISLGYFVDDARKWAVETYVLAAPLNASVSATGRSTTRLDRDTDELYQRPFGLQGQKIISTKLLPPTVIFGRYWGGQDSKLKPYTALMATYAIFFDTKATEQLNKYVGGTSPGDTTVSIKNAFGVGPVVGLKYQFAEKWHASLNIGHVKLKTQATLTTRNTMITSSTGAIQDYGPLSDDIVTGEQTFAPGGTAAAGARAIVTHNGGLVNLVSKGIAAAKGQENLGTYIRKTDTTLTNTLFMLSVGRDF